MIRLYFSTMMFFLCCSALAQEVLPLYVGEIPNSIINTDYVEIETNHEKFGKIISKVSMPSLTAFFPKKPNGTSVIICPGGGYGVLLTEREGSVVAKEFAEIGITAFVLKYRLPNAEIMKDKSIGPLQDIQQAIKIVRTHSRKWNIQSNRIGVMGFSAGGHLAASLATCYKQVLIENKEKVKLRPDFLLLIYPLISFQDNITHIDSRINLLGSLPSQKKKDHFSAQLNVSKHTPPTFITYASDDSVVDPQNSFVLFDALKKNRVTVNLKVYIKGEHGYIVEPDFQDWFKECIVWIDGLF